MVRYAVTDFIINKARIKKGLPSCDSSFCYAKIKEERIDNLANIVRKNLDMNFVKKLTGL